MYSVAKEPDDLEKFFVERANSGDVDWLLALYEPNATVVCGGGDLALTSSQHGKGDVSTEIARRQPDGNWLWVVDQLCVRKVV